MSDADERKDEPTPTEPTPPEEESSTESTNAAASEETEATNASASDDAETTDTSPESEPVVAVTRERAPSQRPARRAPANGARRSARDARGGAGRTLAWAALALVIGAAGGWAAREARAHTLFTKSGSDSGESSCKVWEAKICDSLGAEAFSCLEAKAASSLLPTAACDEALEAVPDTLAKVKEARQGCERLVSKLCQDVGPGTPTCEMVREKTPSFPPDRCDAMLENYDQVLGQLRMMEQAQGRMVPSGPVGHDGHGHPPVAPMPPAGP